MKNRKLIVCIIIFVFLVTVVVMTSAIFALNTVSINFLSTTNKLTNKNDEIVKSGNFSMGKNVLFLNKKHYIDTLEKNNPYLKVINIETKFPNKLVINCAERVEVFAIKLDDNSYVICDEDFKVLNKISTFVNTPENAILLNNGDNKLKEISNTNIGDFLQFNKEQKLILRNTFNSFKEWDLSYNNLKAKIKHVTIDYERKNQIEVQMRSGVQILIKDADKFNSDKFNLAFSTYDSNIKYQNEGIIEVRLVKENDKMKLKAFFTSANL